MRTDELRTLLHERGDEVVDHGAPARVGAMHERVRAVRRRRAAVAGGGLVAAVAAVALAVVPGTILPDQPAPAGPVEGVLNEDGYAKDGVTYRPEVLGERLLGAGIGAPGETELFVDLEVGRTGLRFSPLCYGVGTDWAVEVAVEGHPVSGSACQEGKDTDPGANGYTFDAPPSKLLREWGVKPGQVATVTVGLTPAEGDGGDDTSEHENAVIGVGVYEDTRPHVDVAGVEVPELMEYDGRVWEMAGQYESDPGRPTIWIGRDPGDSNGPSLTVAAVSGLRGPARYTILLDGKEAGGSELTSGATGPSWETLGVLDAENEGFGLRMRVDKGLTDTTRLGFATFYPVD